MFKKLKNWAISSKISIYELENNRININKAKSNLTEKDFLKLISNIYTNCVQRLSEASE